jgi:hypothetical protein
VQPNPNKNNDGVQNSIDEPPPMIAKSPAAGDLFHPFADD